MFSDLIYRLRAMLFRNKIERELDDEVRFHLDRQTAKHIAAGLQPQEAARQARVELAGAEQMKERCRDARGVGLFENAAQDLQYSLRQFGRAPGFVAVAISVLALGIGANTAIFSLLDTVILRSVPVKDPQLLVVPNWSAKAWPKPLSISGFEPCGASADPAPVSDCSFSYPLFRLIAARSDLFSSVTAFAGPFIVNSTASGSAERARAEFASGSFFKTLGIGVALGRPFEDSDDTLTAEPVVVLSHDYWKNTLGEDPRVIGKVIRLNNAPYTVIGVAQPGFNHLSPGRPTALWVPLASGARLGIGWYPVPLGDTHDFWLKIIGRVKPRITTAQLQAALSRTFANYMLYGSRLIPKGSDPAIHLNSANSALVGLRNELSKPIYILMWGVGLILLIACANIATLMTARTAARQREIAIRLAIGASRERIVRQLLTESILLASLGGAFGIVLAFAATRALTTFLSGVQMQIDVHPNLHLLLFATLVSLASGILFGLAPALQSTAVKATGAFEGLQTAMSQENRRLAFRHALLVVQVALSTVMLVGSVLFIRTLHNLTTTELGFNPRNLLLFAVDPVSSGYKPAAVPALYENIADRLRALPSVRSVAYSSDALLNGHSSSSEFVIEGRPDQSTVEVKLLGIGPKFLDTLGIPLVAGRQFNPVELSRHLPVAIVNREFARRYLPTGNPIHRRFAEKDSQPYEIVGVVGDAKYNSVRDAVLPTAYLPLSPGGAHFELRTGGNPARLMPAIEKLMRQIDRNLPVFDLRTQMEQIDQTLFVEQLLTRLTTIFGLLALLLTSVGLYGLLSYEVTCRTREIGVRMAIGAQARQVQRMVLAKTALTVLIGLALGLPLSYAATQLITSMLYGVKAHDVFTFVAVVLLFLIVASVAAYIPARRASRLDPMIALRSE